MALALLTLTVAQLFDLGTFVRMVAGHGAAAEANPLVRFLLTGYGLPLLAVAKIAGLALVVAVIAVLARGSETSSRRAIALVFGVAIVAGLIGGWSNAAALL